MNYCQGKVLISLFLICILFKNSVWAIIRGSLDLYCDFETTCTGWRNGTELDEKIGFNVARAVVVDPWHSVPWPFQGVYFAYVLGNGDETPQVAWLTTDTIPCLLSPSYLTLYYWKNSFLSGLFSGGLPFFKVGIRQPPWSPNIRVLSTVTGNNQWGWRFAVIEVPPVNDTFQLVIEAVVQGKLDVVGLDDIVFHGYISEHDCGNREGFKTSVSRELSPFGKPVEYEKSVQPNDPDDFDLSKNSNLLPSSSSSIQQNFQKDRRPTTIQRGRPSSAAEVSRFFHRETETGSPPFIQEPASINAASDRRSSVIDDRTEQITPGNPFVLQGGGLSQLTAATGGDRQPGNTQATRLVVDIRPSTPVFKHVTTGNCTAVNCGFEGDSCLYEGTDGSSGAWIIMQGRMGNPLTGVTGPAFGLNYAVAYTVNESSTQILRGQPFVTTEKTYLTFWYYFATARSGRLVLCDNSLETCLWEQTTTSITADSRKWKTTTVQLKPGRHQLFFVAEDLRANYYAALDQIYLRRTPTGQFAECQLVS